MKKKILVGSFGHKFPDRYPPIADNLATLQHIRDIRNVVDDPHGQFDESGLDQVVSKFVLSDPDMQQFILDQKIIITSFLKELVKSGKEEKNQLNIYYGCSGGYQRSVAVVEELYLWLMYSYGNDFDIQKEHRTLQLCVDIMAQRKKEAK